MFDKEKEKIERLERGQRALSIFAIIAISVSFGFTLDTMLEEKSSLYYTNVPFLVYDSDLERGEMISVIVGSCNDTDKVTTYTVSRQLESVDGSMPPIELESIDITTLPGCGVNVYVSEIPEDAPTGTFKVTGMSEVFSKNGPRYIDWETQTFTIR